MLRPRTRTMRQPSQPRSLRSVGAVGALRSEDGIDDLDVRRVGAGLEHGLDVLRRPVDLGEAVHEVDPRQPAGAVDVLLAGAAWQHDPVGEAVDLRIFRDLRRPSRGEPGRAFGRICLQRPMPPIRNLILVLGDQLSTCKGYLLRRESLSAVRPGLSTGSGDPAV